MKTVEFKTGDVNESLGMVEYLLTDKTGTLTDNSVSIDGFIINGFYFGKQLELYLQKDGLMTEIPFRMTESLFET